MQELQQSSCIPGSATKKVGVKEGAKVIWSKKQVGVKKKGSGACCNVYDGTRSTCMSTVKFQGRAAFACTLIMYQLAGAQIILGSTVASWALLDWV